MDGEIITAMRTAAVSAVATKALAQETSILSVIGSGVQAKSHIEAFLKTFPITKVLTFHLFYTTILCNRIIYAFKLLAVRNIS
jgi:ornithine cyclodeaminase/alanine dehydrogenase-like protein (mu-crystallin family)